MGFWKRVFKTEAEKKRVTRKDGRLQLEAMDHADRRDILRDAPGQWYEIVKLDWDGRGNNRTICQETEEEPTAERINAKYYDKYGGGDYKIFTFKPHGRMHFRTFSVEGDSILPEKGGRKSADPMKRLVNKTIDNMPPRELEKLGPALLAKELGLSNPNSSFGMHGQPMSVIEQERIYIARDLRAQGKYAEAAQTLTGNVPKSKSEIDVTLAILDKILGINEKLGGKGKSEEAEIIEAYGKAGKEIVGGIKETAVEIVGSLTGQVSDDESGEGTRFFCGVCKKEMPNDQLAKCPNCGAKFKEEGTEGLPDHSQPIYETEVPDESVDPEPEKPAKIILSPKLSKSEKDFLYKALPKIFLNRIKRWNGEPHERWFKIMFSKKACAPKNAAMFDVEYLKNNNPDQADDALKSAMVGYKDMIGKFEPIVNNKIEQYEEWAIEFRKLGKADFTKQYPNITRKDLSILNRYMILKNVWDYMQASHSIQWWNEYCAEVVKLLSVSDTIDIVDEEDEEVDTDGATTKTGDKEPEAQDIGEVEGEGPPNERGTEESLQ